MAILVQSKLVFLVVVPDGVRFVRNVYACFYLCVGSERPAAIWCYFLDNHFLYFHSLN